MMTPEKFSEQHNKNAARADDLKILCGKKFQARNLVYCLPDIEPDKPVTFFITGCQGAGNHIQKEVARAMNSTYEKNYKHKNVIGLLLGDNIYDYGATSATDIAFEKCFSSLYSKKIPWAAILGNHDWNFQNPIKSAIGRIRNPLTSNFDRANAQVEHTYCKDEFGRKIDQWFMPHRYYVLETPHANIFCLDSNTLCFDEKQQLWLLDTYAELNNNPKKLKMNIISQHHPLHTSGKRHTESGLSDIEYYLLPEYKYSGPITGTLNSLLFSLMQILTRIYNRKHKSHTMTFDLVICAHDHYLAYNHIPNFKYQENKMKKDLPQLTVGGGAGKIQNIVVKKALRLGECEFTLHGYVTLTISSEKISINFYRQTGSLLYSTSLQNTNNQT